MVTVASSSPIGLRIHSRPKNPDKPGLEPPLKMIHIAGNTAPGSINGLGVTRDVDEATLNDWLEDHPEHKGVLKPMTDDELDEHADLSRSSGFEPALEQFKGEGSEGSTITDEHVSDHQLAATSDVPNDDSPASQSTLTQADAMESVSASDEPATEKSRRGSKKNAADESTEESAS